MSALFLSDFLSDCQIRMVDFKLFLYEVRPLRKGIGFVSIGTKRCKSSQTLR